MHLIFTIDDETGTEKTWVTCPQAKTWLQLSPQSHTASGQGRWKTESMQNQLIFSPSFQGFSETLGQNTVTSLLTHVPATNLLPPQPPLDCSKRPSCKHLPQEWETAPCGHCRGSINVRVSSSAGTSSQVGFLTLKECIHLFIPPMFIKHLLCANLGTVPGPGNTELDKQE